MRLRPTRKGAEETDPGHMTLMDHLKELRNRVIKCCIAVAVGAVAGWFLYESVFTLLTRPYCNFARSTDQPCRLYFTDLLAGLMLHIKVSMYTGLLIALPVVLWQLWRFISPGLYRNERRYAFAFVGSSMVLFALGATLAFFTLPPMLEWLVANSGPSDLVQQITTADRYFWLVALMMVGFGIGFEFPVVLVALQLMGVLDNATLRKYRRHAFVGIVVLVAVITPSGDPISLFALSLPMYLFYEVSIVIGMLVKRRRRRRQETPPSSTTPTTPTKGADDEVPQEKAPAGTS